MNAVEIKNLTKKFGEKTAAKYADEIIDSRDRRLKFMRQFECIADKRTYTESQLRQLFQFKVVHGYDDKFENVLLAVIEPIFTISPLFCSLICFIQACAK